MIAPDPVGIRAIATALSPRFEPVENLRTQSGADTLRGFGFEGAWIDGDVPEMACAAAKQALKSAGVPANELDVLLWASALSNGHERASGSAGENGILGRFCYQGSWLQEELGLERATVSGVAQQGCAGMFSALRQGRALLLAEPEIHHVLCVGADAFPAGEQRELLYNVISDAGCACVISREAAAFRWLAHHQISKGYYWDVPAKQSEIIAAYFPTAVIAIRGALKKADLEPGEIDLVIPTGVNRASWPILMRLCGVPEAHLYQPRQSFGHTVAADSFLALEDALVAGALKPGMKLLLFAYGFGSSWSALILETTEHLFV